MCAWVKLYAYEIAYSICQIKYIHNTHIQTQMVKIYFAKLESVTYNMISIIVYKISQMFQLSYKIWLLFSIKYFSLKSNTNRTQLYRKYCLSPFMKWTYKH